MPEPYVPRIRLNPDNSVALDVTLVGFSEGKSAEISGYVTQNTKVFPFYSVQPVPAPNPATGTSSLTVTLPPMQGLALGQDVTVITRVTEVLIWPTVLAYSSEPGPAPQATWVAKSYTPDPADQGPSQSKVYAAPTPPVPATPSSSEWPPPTSGSPFIITAGGVRITIEAAGQ